MLALGFLRSRDSSCVENVHRAKALVEPRLEERIAEAQPRGRRAQARPTRRVLPDVGEALLDAEA